MEKPFEGTLHIYFVMFCHRALWLLPVQINTDNLKICDLYISRDSLAAALFCAQPGKQHMLQTHPDRHRPALQQTLQEKGDIASNNIVAKFIVMFSIFLCPCILLLLTCHSGSYSSSMSVIYNWRPIYFKSLHLKTLEHWKCLATSEVK